MKILIAHDGSAGADEAISDLPRAGMPREAEALLLNVRELWLPNFAIKRETNQLAVSASSSPIGYVSTPIVRATVPTVEPVSVLHSAAARLRAMFPDWKTETLDVAGSAAREIVENAKLWSADIVIIGANGNTGFKQTVLGSVAQKIANEAECSVRIVRGESWKNGSPSRLLIALDGTVSGMAAVEEVKRRMWTMGSEVRLVVVQDSLQTDSTRICEYVENAKKTLIAADLSVTELIEDGDPKQLIISAAEEWGADCIFLGASDSVSSYQQLLLGGVSTAVVSRAHCTVEIVRKKKAATIRNV